MMRRNRVSLLVKSRPSSRNVPARVETYRQPVRWPVRPRAMFLWGFRGNVPTVPTGPPLSSPGGENARDPAPCPEGERADRPLFSIFPKVVGTVGTVGTFPLLRGSKAYRPPYRPRTGPLRRRARLLGGMHARSTVLLPVNKIPKTSPEMASAETAFHGLVERHSETSPIGRFPNATPVWSKSLTTS